MKLFVLAVAITIIQAKLSPEQKVRVHEFRLECQNESGVSDEAIHEAVHGNFEDSEVLKKHLLCLAQKLGYMDAEGNVNRDRLRKGAQDVSDDKEIANRVAEKCGERKITPEKTAFYLFKCFYDETH